MMKAVKLTVLGLLSALLLTAVGVGLLAWHEGYRAYAVRTGSMTPTYPTGALVIDQPIEGSRPSVWQVITFLTTDGPVTHRVHDVTPQGLKTKGDANRTPDAWTVPLRHVMGTVVWGSAYLGYVFVFFQQPTGVLSLMLLALSVYLAWTVFFPAKPEEPEPASSSSADEPVSGVAETGPAVIDVRVPTERPAFVVLPGEERVPARLDEVGPTRGQSARSGLLSA
jgi:signal peptidase